MNPLDQQRRLVSKLAELTDASKLTWESDEDGEPFARFKGYFINLKEGRSARGSTIYKVIIEDGSQKTIEAFNDEDIDDEGEVEYYTLLKRTIQSARRVASGADIIINEILQGLDDL